MVTTPPRKRPRGIYLLPNLFTTGCLFCGFYAVTASMNGQFDRAAFSIFAAMVLDGLDGRVARLTHTQTAFGGEYDSLSDMVSFGLAPALIMYLWSLSFLAKLGWFASFVYAAAAALRLARFNTQIGVEDKRYFQGLPSPSAAAMVAGMIWLGENYGLQGEAMRYVAVVMTTVAALLMVSNFRYYSFKDIDIRGRVPFVVIILIMLGFAVVFTNPQLMLVLIFSGYAVSGPLLTLIWLRQRRMKKRHR
ncbi:CDP-diacylglycerol--serine O-phosphatidyltransferase [Methylohalobius crimeensis]|uniref:CDP-diacylglycerol--serine O-phosphatidyltransferase n=1 Tax=Methylohalobius crimeensis TaxID=244365 RepID=UPI0003B61DFF|nr:CDP-diacylglycerol--serine O-phosphatidyltransferase [Methylohalobius crimeensis]